tara:strand:+ start:243 stop:416 length:174 start_codon:yes stop_codon:yes gene_type:complete
MPFITAETLASDWKSLPLMNNFGTIRTCFAKLGKERGKVELLLIELSGDEPPPKEAD